MIDKNANKISKCHGVIAVKALRKIGMLEYLCAECGKHCKVFDDRCFCQSWEEHKREKNRVNLVSI